MTSINRNARVDEERLRSVLQKYRAWMDENIPASVRKLRKGLSREKIRSFIVEQIEKYEDSFPFPESHYSLFEYFDGQKGYRFDTLPSLRGGINQGMMIGNLDDVYAWRSSELGMIYLLKELNSYRSVTIDKNIREIFWEEKWFPFARCEFEGEISGNIILFIDFFPSDTGKYGQIVADTKILENDNLISHLNRRVIASSLADYFEEIVDDMYAGRIVYDPKFGVNRI